MPGTQVPYTITVTNTGPVVAPAVVVTDTLPAGLSYVSSVPACTATGQVVTCPLGDLAAGTSATIDLVTLAQGPLPVVGGQVVNVAVVVGSEFELWGRLQRSRVPRRVAAAGRVRGG